MNADFGVVARAAQALSRRKEPEPAAVPAPVVRPWTTFTDMHSGGGAKTPYPFIAIEAPEATAKLVFERVFGRDPEHVTCRCCGEDFSVSEAESYEKALEDAAEAAHVLFNGAAR
jgi:hypothetical protein